MGGGDDGDDDVVVGCCGGDDSDDDSDDDDVVVVGCWLLLLLSLLMILLSMMFNGKVKHCLREAMTTNSVISSKKNVEILPSFLSTKHTIYLLLCFHFHVLCFIIILRSYVHSYFIKKKYFRS